MRLPVLPLYWRVRLGMWLPATVAWALSAWHGPWPAVLAIGAVLSVLLMLLCEPLVRAVRAQSPPVAAPTPPSLQQPEPAAIGAAEALAQALDEGGLTVLYRPLRRLPDLDLCGVEAELRWRHPLAGLLPPAGWPHPLPEALAVRLLDRWLVDACSQFARWGLRPASGEPAQLWLPMVPAWLACPGLAQALDRAVASAGLMPDQVRLRCAPRQQDRLAVLPEPLPDLQQRGFGVAADDFGTGSASLAHLTGLPLRAVCLDRSFVERADRAPQRLVVESTARLAASLGMQTLADGIASTGQAQALAAMGCELGLGEACGPWLEAGDWSPRWSGPRFADTGADTTAV